MTDTPTPTAPAADVPVPPPASPYGPTSTAGATRAPQPAWVDRGRRVLTVAIWITAGLSIALTVVLIILGVTNPGADDLGFDEFADTLVWGSIFAAPISITIAINLLVWRALLRPLAGRTRGQAFALVAVTVLSLAVASVVMVTVLLFFGFLVGASTSVGA